MEGLTQRQGEVLRAIETAIERTGRSPTTRQLADWFGFASVNAINDHLRALRRKGFIDWQFGSVNTLRLTKRAQRPGIEWLSLCEACGMLVVPSKHSHAPADVVDRGA